MQKSIIIFLIAMCTLTGCNVEDFESATPSYGHHFIKIYEEDSGDIVYDSRTGVQYWKSTMSGSYGELTLLVDSEGKPLIYKGE